MKWYKDIFQNIFLNYNPILEVCRSKTKAKKKREPQKSSKNKRNTFIFFLKMNEFLKNKYLQNFFPSKVKQCAQSGEEKKSSPKRCFMSFLSLFWKHLHRPLTREDQKGEGEGKEEGEGQLKCLHIR